MKVLPMSHPLRFPGWLGLLLVLTACGSGAVMFAPTPPPPDVSPRMYQHPSGAFTLAVPRNWTLYEQNLTTLATASFAPPGATEPLLLVSAINLGRDLDSAAFGAFINQYQAEIRADVNRYTEQARQAMGDGSWRLTGLRTTPGRTTESINTFIERRDGLVGVIEVVLPSDDTLFTQVQMIVNTFALSADSDLQPTRASDLTFAQRSGLDVLHVATWTTPAGVFFITGEVANHGSMTLTDIPVRAVLRTGDDLAVAEATDTVMGYGVAPGGFAPFSLRFGQGQPALTDTFELYLGGDDWEPGPPQPILGADELMWTDDSEFDGQRLIISGEVTNISREPARAVQAVVTVFDQQQLVIAAGFTPVAVETLAPGETAPFQLVVSEMGGEPADYIVSVQGRP